MAVAYTYPLRAAPYVSAAQNGETPAELFNEITITAAFVLNDTVQVFVAPKGFRVTGALLSATDLDTNGSPAIVLALGDAGDDDRFITGSTIAQAGGVTTALALAGVGYLFTADTPIYVKATTAPATGTTGTVKAGLKGYFDSAWV